MWLVTQRDIGEFSGKTKKIKRVLRREKMLCTFVSEHHLPFVMYEEGIIGSLMIIIFSNIFTDSEEVNNTGKKAVKI